MRIHWSDVESPLGGVRVWEARDGVLASTLPGDDPEPAAAELARFGTVDTTATARSAVARFVTKLLAGRDPGALPNLDLRWTTTAFVSDVLRATAEVPWGQVTTYGELANALGRPGGARAVGNALGSNRLPLVIPCHRVVPANGTVGGFGAGRGATGLKAALLALEAWVPRR